MNMSLSWLIWVEGISIKNIYFILLILENKILFVMSIIKKNIRAIQFVFCMDIFFTQIIKKLWKEINVKFCDRNV